MNKVKTPIEGFVLFDNSDMSRIVNKITLTSGYQLNFPAAFYKVNQLSKKNAAKLYFNPTDNKIAIEFIEENEPKAFKLILSNNGKYGGYIAAKSFLTLNKIDIRKYGGRYDYEKRIIGDTEFYIVNLKDKEKANQKGDDM